MTGTATTVGCRAPARSADKNHTRDHAKGGPTIGPNLGDACRHGHRLKHEGDWTLHQSQPGVFRWTRRLGRIYHTRPQPITTDLPDPALAPNIPITHHRPLSTRTNRPRSRRA